MWVPAKCVCLGRGEKEIRHLELHTLNTLYKLLCKIVVASKFIGKCN